MANHVEESIEVGFQVFLKDGGEEVGAVREVRAKARELLVNVENAGDFVVRGDAVKAVHSHKVILDAGKIDARLKAALRHAHDAEEPGR
jgi:hypothetical protein